MWCGADAARYVRPMKRLCISLTVLACLACSGLPTEPPPASAEEGPGAPVVVDTPTVAVLYFDYDGDDGDLASLRKGLAQMIITDMAANEGFVVVERERLQDILDELDLNASGRVDPSKAVQIGKLVGADLMVMGSYFEAMGTFRVDTRIVDTATSVITCGVGETGKRDDFLGMQSRLSDKLSIAVLSDGEDCTSPRPSKPPPQPALERKQLKKLPVATAVTYSKALEASDGGDVEQAKTLLTEVVKEEPAFTLAADELAGLML